MSVSILDAINDLMSRAEHAGFEPAGVVLGQEQGYALACEVAHEWGRPFSGPEVFEKMCRGGNEVWGVPFILVDRPDHLAVATGDLRWFSSTQNDNQNAAARTAGARQVLASMGRD